MKIYDCFLFFNELDLLEVRLNELDPYVDFFVLAEAEESFQGNSKPLFFEDNRERFSKFLDKVIHLKIPANPGLKAWGRQHYQRRFLGNGLEKANPEDVIIISDLDEIPKGSKITEKLPVKGEVTEFIMRTYSHYLNRRLLRKDPKYKKMGGQDANSSIMVRYSDFTNAEDVRRLKGKFKNYRSEGKVAQISDAGWHLSWMGDFEHISYKAESVSGPTALNSKSKNKKAWDSQIEQIRSGDRLEGYFPQKKVEYRIEDITTDSHPKFIVDNLEKFKSWIYEK